MLRGLLFVQSGSFVNTSRINPAKLIVESGRMKISGTKHNAVGVMLGVVSDCFIIEEMMAGSIMSPYPVHKITIVPFTQEIRRDTSVWGLLFGFRTIAGAVSTQGFSFSTRKKADHNQSKLRIIFVYLSCNNALLDPNLSPKKSNGIFTTVSSPLVSTSKGSHTSYPSSRAFEDHSKASFDSFRCVNFLFISPYIRWTFQCGTRLFVQGQRLQLSHESPPFQRRKTRSQGQCGCGRGVYVEHVH
jgi:hypothetical protein